MLLGSLFYDVRADEWLVTSVSDSQLAGKRLAIPGEGSAAYASVAWTKTPGGLTRVQSLTILVGRSDFRMPATHDIRKIPGQ